MMERIAMALAACLLLGGCASAQAVEPREHVVLDAAEAAYEPPAEETISGDLSADLGTGWTETPEAPETWPTEDESAPCGDFQADYGTPDYGYEPTCPEPAAYEPADGLTREGGVNHHEGRTETYYSSNVLYHVDTPEWATDDEGFYRTDEGYYVVAASDMPQGTVFETSKGEAIVLDTGCAGGVTDFYVAW